MNNETTLEQELRIIIDEYRRLKAADLAHTTYRQEQALLISQLEERNLDLRRSIDSLNADRFSLKRLRDERNRVRRKLKSALSRMEALEKEVLHVLDE